MDALRQVCHFVGDDIGQHRLRRHHQAPRERKPAVGGARGPAGSRIAKRDPPGPAPQAAGQGLDPGFDLAPRLAAQPVAEAPGQVLRSAGDDDLAVPGLDRQAAARAMADKMVDAEDRDNGAIGEPNSRA